MSDYIVIKLSSSWNKEDCDHVGSRAEVLSSTAMYAMLGFKQDGITV